MINKESKSSSKPPNRGIKSYTSLLHVEIGEALSSFTYPGSHLPSRSVRIGQCLSGFGFTEFKGTRGEMDKEVVLFQSSLRRNLQVSELMSKNKGNTVSRVCNQTFMMAANKCTCTNVITNVTSLQFACTIMSCKLSFLRFPSMEYSSFGDILCRQQGTKQHLPSQIHKL